MRPAPLAHVVRGDVVESVHHGHLVALDGHGARALAVGDPDVTFFLAPRQAGAGRGDAAAGLDLSGELLALAAASHGGEPAHLDGVRRILDGAGLRVDDLQNTPDLPLDLPAATCWRAEQRPPRRSRRTAPASTPRCWRPAVSRAGTPRPTSIPVTHCNGGARDGRRPHRRSRGTDRRGRLRRPAVLQHPGRARPGLRADRDRAARHPGRAGGDGLARPPVVGRGNGSGRRPAHRRGARPDRQGRGEGVFAAALPDGRAVVLKVLDGAVRPVRAVGGSAEGAGRRRAGARRGRAHRRARARRAGGPRRAGWARPRVPPQFDGPPVQNRDVQTGERPRGARTAAPSEGEPAQPTADLASPRPPGAGSPPARGLDGRTFRRGVAACP